MYFVVDLVNRYMFLGPEFGIHVASIL
jgi:hypothetical protein